MPHVHEKIDFTSEVFIVFKKRVLLRKHDKLKIWMSVGGHIELDEDPNEAAIREVKEEIGLEVRLDDSLLPVRPSDHTKELIPPYFLNRHKMSDTHEHVSFVYFAKATNDKIAENPHEKSEECRWFSKEELEKNTEILPNIKFYALEALRKLSDQ